MSISVFSAVGRRSSDAACIRVTVRHIGDIGRTSGVQKSGSETVLDLFSTNLFDTELYSSGSSDKDLLGGSLQLGCSQPANPLFSHQ